MPTDEQLRSVAETLARSAATITRRLKASGFDAGLSLGEAMTLGELARHGPATSADLARRELMSPQSMAARLTPLHTRGLIARSPDPGDGRRILYTVTDDGRRTHAERVGLRAGQVADALAHGFTDEERDALARAAPLLARLAARLC